MWAYLLRRLLLIVPTLFGVLLINFVIIQAAPGGPVEQMIAKLQGIEAASGGGTARIGGGGQEVATGSMYRGAQGLDAADVLAIEKMYGFDKPAYERFWLMLKGYAQFDFGTSFTRDRPVIDIIIEKIPVSLSLGLWSTLITYMVSIPLGVAKAVRSGSAFDIWTSTVIVIGYAVPAFLFAIVLIIFFAGGGYWNWFPLRGLVSSDFDDMTHLQQLVDYAKHLVLPTIALVIGNFATLTFLTKNSFMDEINKLYVTTAKAKGLTQKQVLYRHVFRNAMLIVIAGFPAALLGMLFTSSLLIEVMFSLDGFGLLSFESAVKRDYPVVFGCLFIFTLIGLLMKIISDLIYTWVDPRIDFESRGH